MGEHGRKRARMCQLIQRGERRTQTEGQEELEALSYKAEMTLWRCVSVRFYFGLISEVEADDSLNEDKDLITSAAIICKFGVRQLMTV